MRLKADCFFDGFDASSDAWEIEWFVDEAKGSVPATDPFDWGFEVEEGSFLDGSSNFTGKPARQRSFMRDDQATSLLY